VTWEFALGHALFAFGRVAAGAHDAENRLVQGISTCSTPTASGELQSGAGFLSRLAGIYFINFIARSAPARRRSSSDTITGKAGQRYGF
jgi:hypothetical protein